jgi:hypothetical protein
LRARWGCGTIRAYSQENHDRISAEVFSVPVHEPEWKEACAVVGELVLLYSALDHQLNRIIIEVMHLGMSPMLEAVVATLDARQKIEILKNRANHVKQKDWEKALTTHADRLERVSRLRNAACHTPMIRNEAKGHFEFAPAAASKLMKSITIKDKNDYAVERLTLERMREIIHLGEKALGGGEDILTNFAKVRAVLAVKNSTT